MKIKRPAGVDKVEQNMTPMIDIVFQLLTFFVMSFKIASPEGDFNVKMPAMGMPSQNNEEPPEEIKIKLTAGLGGTLASISMGSTPIPSFPALRTEIMRIVGPDTGPGTRAEKIEVELDCDYSLHYKHVMNAITAISGRLDAAGNPIKLIEKIKFAPQKAGPQ